MLCEVHVVSIKDVNALEASWGLETDENGRRQIINDDEDGLVTIIKIIF